MPHGCNIYILFPRGLVGEALGYRPPFVCCVSGPSGANRKATAPKPWAQPLCVWDPCAHSASLVYHLEQYSVPLGLLVCLSVLLDLIEYCLWRHFGSRVSALGKLRHEKLFSSIRSNFSRILRSHGSGISSLGLLERRRSQLI